MLELLDNYRTPWLIYNYYMGIEKNPRNTSTIQWNQYQYQYQYEYEWDWKLFFNTRLGIALWPVILIALMSSQQKITNSLLLISFFQCLYVIDLFVHERWYLYTIDIAQERFGFMLIWGDIVWLPGFYTIGPLYIAKYGNPILDHSNALAIAFGVLGLLSFALFRWVNSQRDRCRALAPVEAERQGWTFIDVTYKVIRFESGEKQNGRWKLHWETETRGSRLVTNGSWGWARHFNYLTDLAFSAMWAGCGGTALVPWLYTAYLAILLVHRIQRDQDKCRCKYGAAWDQYCKTVKYKLIPGVW